MDGRPATGGVGFRYAVVVLVAGRAAAALSAASEQGGSYW